MKRFLGRVSRALILPAILLAIPAALPAREAPPGPAAERASPGAPVVFNGKTLFHIQRSLLTLTPEERARLIQERITGIADNPSVTVESIRVVDAGTSSEVAAGDRPILSVTDDDAKAMGRDREVLAGQYAYVIREAVRSSRRSLGTWGLVESSFELLLATVALIFLLRGVGRLRRWLLARVGGWQGTHIRSLHIQRLEILSAEQITRSLLFLIRTAALVAVLALLYFYIPLALSFFPWTRGLATGFVDYLLAPLWKLGGAFVSYLPKLLFVAVVVVVTRYVLKATHFVFTAIERGTLSFRGFHPEWAQPTYSIAKILILAFAAVVAFPYLPGATTPAFQGISIFLGVLFSLGSTSAVANLVAGIILTYMRPFRVGDRVKIADTVGDILEKSLLLTRIRTIKNVDITVPNALVLGSHIINYSSSSGDPHLILHSTVTIGYDAPWRKVHQLLAAAAEATEGILKDPAPFVLQTSLNDFFVTYEINAYTDNPRAMASTYSRLHENIQDRFNEAGVEILSPHYTQLRDGNKAALPDEYLPPGYEPGGLRIRSAGSPGPERAPGD